MNIQETKGQIKNLVAENKVFKALEVIREYSDSIYTKDLKLPSSERLGLSNRIAQINELKSLVPRVPVSIDRSIVAEIYGFTEIQCLNSLKLLAKDYISNNETEGVNPILLKPRKITDKPNSIERHIVTFGFIAGLKDENSNPSKSMTLWGLDKKSIKLLISQVSKCVDTCDENYFNKVLESSSFKGEGDIGIFLDGKIVLKTNSDGNETLKICREFFNTIDVPSTSAGYNYLERPRGETVRIEVKNISPISIDTYVGGFYLYTSGSEFETDRCKAFILSEIRSKLK